MHVDESNIDELRDADFVFLAVLRAKAPRRALSPVEAAQIADWQATHTAQAGRAHGATDTKQLDNRTSPRPGPNRRGFAGQRLHALAGRRLIVINGSEPYSRQRFSLAHEYKHTIDHRYRDIHHVDRPGLSAYAQAERTADYFAACLLMPRRWIKHAWANGYQSVSELCQLFDVLPPAMARRLEHLGLSRPSEKVGPDSAQSATYERLKRPWIGSRV